MSLSQSTILELTQDLDADAFEHFVGDLWALKGWNTTVTQANHDYGIDIIATRENPHPEKILIQAKRYGPESNVGGPEVQQYASLKQQEPNVDMVLIVTTGGLTERARQYANQLNVKCISGPELAALIQRIGASDLVKRYVDNHFVGSELSLEELDESGLIDYGDSFVLEITGYDFVRGPIKNKRFFFSKSTFSGYLFSMKVYNRDRRPRDIDRSKFFLADQNGEWHDLVALDRDKMPDSWTCHETSMKGYTVTVPVDRPLRYLAGFSLAADDIPERLVIQGEDLEIPLNGTKGAESVRLPESVRSGLNL